MGGTEPTIPKSTNVNFQEVSASVPGIGAGSTNRFPGCGSAWKKWSSKNYPGGYTSYGSLDKIHQMSSTFMDLEAKLQAACDEWKAGYTA